MNSIEEVIGELQKHYNPKNVEGMKRYGIRADKAFGVNAPKMYAIAKQIGKNHKLALELWQSGYHEARHIAAMIDDPELVTKSQMNKWVNNFHSWDIVDGTCSNLFRYTSYALEKIPQWAKSNKEFIRRTAFSMIACIAVHHKKRDDKEFLQFFPLIKKYSIDERNYVKKAINWSLRQIGKRSKFLNKEAIKLAKEIQKLDSKSARWIAGDAIRELTNPKIISRLKR